MQTLRYDLVVLGAGSGGFASARTARSLGASVALVDHGPLGGLCILRGCMPSKTFIASSDAAFAAREAAALGVHTGAVRVNFPEIAARKREIIRGFADDRIAGIKTFPLHCGHAHFPSSNELAVGDELVVKAGRFIIATGSVTAPPFIPGLREFGYLDSDRALELTELPESLIVLGGGYVGTELGQFFARLGVKTTMLMRGQHLLSAADDDVGHALTEYLRAEGIAIVSEAMIGAVGSEGGSKTVSYTRHGRRYSKSASEILFALGRVPNIAGLELEKAGVKAHAVSGIEVDATLRTSNPAIFAVGDVTEVFPLVHVAIHQGEVAARNAVNGTNEEPDYPNYKAHTVFSDPQVAVAGESERELVAKGIPYVRASYAFAEHGKAIALGRTKGFVKMMAAPDDGTILGVTILGPEASDLIHEAIVAMRYRATVAEFARIPHLHPTLAEILTYPAEEIAERLAEGRPLAAPERHVLAR